MPQMSPMSWLILFLMFSMAFIIFNIMNYYLYLPPQMKTSNLNKLSSNSLNWKW